MSSSLFKVTEHSIDAQHIREHPRATANSHEVPTKLSIKQYTPLTNVEPTRGDVTIIVAGGNGFPKELYEPLWEDLQHRVNKERGYRIRGIWVADMSNQGASGMLNEGNIGNEHAWNDHTRDLLHMINIFRKNMIPPIVGIGHSIGASQIINLSLTHPGLFTSLLFLEPYIQPNRTRQTGHTLVTLSLRRRAIWPSRLAASAAFVKGLKGWDRRVVDRYIEHGLRDISPKECKDKDKYHASCGVTLTTSRDQEGIMMLRPRYSDTAIEEPWPSAAPTDTSKPRLDITERLTFRPEPGLVLTHLPLLRPSVVYAFGELSPVSTPEYRDEKVQSTGTGHGGNGGVAAGAVKSIIVDGQGHLLPFMAVRDCAEIADGWLEGQVREWKERDERWRSGWIDSGDDKMALDEELREAVLKEDWSAEDLEVGVRVPSKL